MMLKRHESEFWSHRMRPLLIKQCQELNLRHHFERIENVVTDGGPDVDYCVAGVCGKIELKFAPHHPARDTSQVLGIQHGMRRSQITWACKRTWAGGRVYLLIGTPVRAWLIDLAGKTAPEMDALARATVQELDVLAAWVSDSVPRRYLPPTLIG